MSESQQAAIVEIDDVDLSFLDDDFYLEDIDETDHGNSVHRLKPASARRRIEEYFELRELHRQTSESAYSI